MKYIHITKENIDREHICCAMSGKQALAKKEWLKKRFDEGLVFYRSEERGKCFIEYIPAENAWVPIEAGGWLYINCLWVSGSMKGHGYSSELLSECIRVQGLTGKESITALTPAEAQAVLAELRRRSAPAAAPQKKRPRSIKALKSQIYLTVGSTSCTCPLQRMRISRDSKIVPDIRKSAKRALSSIIPTSALSPIIGCRRYRKRQRNTAYRFKHFILPTKKPRRMYLRRSPPLPCSGMESF